MLSSIDVLSLLHPHSHMELWEAGGKSMNELHLKHPCETFFPLVIHPRSSLSVSVNRRVCHHTWLKVGRGEKIKGGKAERKSVC